MTVISLNGTRESKYGRSAGGITVFYKNYLSKGIEHVYKNSRNAILLHMKKSFFGLHQDVLLVFTYIPPEGSRIYNNSNINIMEELQETLIEFIVVHNCHILCCGDFNARTGDLDDYIKCDRYVNDDHDENMLPFQKERVSKDKCVNSFGEKND